MTQEMRRESYVELIERGAGTPGLLHQRQIPTLRLAETSAIYPRQSPLSNTADLERRWPTERGDSDCKLIVVARRLGSARKMEMSADNLMPTMTNSCLEVYLESGAKGAGILLDLCRILLLGVNLD